MSHSFYYNLKCSIDDQKWGFYWFSPSLRPAGTAWARQCGISSFINERKYWKWYKLTLAGFSLSGIFWHKNTIKSYEEIHHCIDNSHLLCSQISHIFVDKYLSQQNYFLNSFLFIPVEGITMMHEFLVLLQGKIKEVRGSLFKAWNFFSCWFRNYRHE